MNIVIVGIGKLGSKLAEILASEENNIKWWMSIGWLDRLANRADVLTVQGNGVQLEVLEKLDMWGQTCWWPPRTATMLMSGLLNCEAAGMLQSRC